jgi:hypothetical protein
VGILKKLTVALDAIAASSPTQTVGQFQLDKLRQLAKRLAAVRISAGDRRGKVFFDEFLVPFWEKETRGARGSLILTMNNAGKLAEPNSPEFWTTIAIHAFQLSREGKGFSLVTDLDKLAAVQAVAAGFADALGPANAAAERVAARLEQLERAHKSNCDASAFINSQVADAQVAELQRSLDSAMDAAFRNFVQTTRDDAIKSFSGKSDAQEIAQDLARIEKQMDEMFEGLKKARNTNLEALKEIEGRSDLP